MTLIKSNDSKIESDLGLEFSKQELKFPKNQFYTSIPEKSEQDLENKILQFKNGNWKLHPEINSKIIENISLLDQSLNLQIDNETIYIPNKESATEIMLSDIGENKAYRAICMGYMLALTSEKDYLTKVNNRESLFRALMQNDLYNHEISIKENRRKKERKPYGMIFIDIDNFKQVNDNTTAKHQQGDYTLKEMANILKKNVEAEIYRYGGEEFVILLSNVTSDKTKEIAERLRKSVENYKFSYLTKEGELTEDKFNLTASLGVAHTNTINQRHQLLTYANTGEKLAKISGKNRVVYGDIENVNSLLEKEYSEITMQMEFYLSNQSNLRSSAYKFMQNITNKLNVIDEKPIKEFLEKDPILEGIEDIVYQIKPCVTDSKTNTSRLELFRGNVIYKNDNSEDRGHLQISAKPEYFSSLKKMIIDMSETKGYTNKQIETMLNGYDVVTNIISQKEENNAVDIYFGFQSKTFKIKLQTEYNEFKNQHTELLNQYSIKRINKKEVELTANK